LSTTNQRSASPRLARLAQWLRHHAAAAVGTAADFLVMVAMVEVVGLVPATATAVGAAGGAATNFLLGRHWAYRRPDGGVLGQALRYVVVSGAGLGLNAGGVYLLAHRVGLHYVAARVITAVVVANAWSYPMQRFFVFGGGGARSRSRSLA
jgi:putative flippase GtrA